MNRIIYADLAKHLRQSEPSATCADLAANLSTYTGSDEAMRDELVAAVQQMPPAAGWLAGLMAMCEVLKRQNIRFEEAIFVDDLVLYDR